MRPVPPLVEDIRIASRRMVRELGFLHPTLAGTDHPPSAVHALLEIEAHGAMTAGQLVALLGLEKSSVSRMVAKLIQAGDLRQTVGGEDARVKPLQLTAQGRRVVRRIHAFGRRQVASALAHLAPAQQQAVAHGIAAYGGALAASRQRGGAAPAAPLDVAAGYRPGLIGRVVEMHAGFYARQAGFGAVFEAQVAAGLAEFVGRLHAPCNGVWTALQHTRIVGAVAIDGQHLGDGQAHLRWFILDEGCRGQGHGRRLLQAALGFCDAQGFASTRLWTFKGLDAARRLYESLGFVLVDEQPGQRWGGPVTEQQFVRRAGQGCA